MYYVCQPVGFLYSPKKLKDNSDELTIMEGPIYFHLSGHELETHIYNDENNLQISFYTNSNTLLLGKMPLGLWLFFFKKSVFPKSENLPDIEAIFLFSLREGRSRFFIALRRCVLRRLSLVWYVGGHVVPCNAIMGECTEQPLTYHHKVICFTFQSARDFYFSFSHSSSPVTVHSPSFYKGEPTLKIRKITIESLSKPFQFSLIGKFSHGWSLMERSRQIFEKLGLKGAYI